MDGAGKSVTTDKTLPRQVGLKEGLQDKQRLGRPERTGKEPESRQIQVTSRHGAISEFRLLDKIILDVKALV